MDLWLVGLQQIFSFHVLLVLVLGVGIGIVFGAIPGLTATMAIALCLPLTFGADPVIGLSLLCGLYVGGIFDAGSLVFFGFLGYAMIRFGYPVTPFILGFVLGPIVEDKLRSGLMSSHNDLTPLFTRPISAFFLFSAAAYLLFVWWRKRWKERRAEHL
jgi:TctA family transporter